jgi:hypothetical protein
MAHKRYLIAVAIMLSALSSSFAQTNNRSDGRATQGATQGSGSPQVQPQGPTGPLETTTGGAPASSPQGETPAGMQPMPQEPSEPNRQKKD